jgi:hypothetical protein
MSGKLFTTIIFAILVIMSIMETSEAGYRKPPFNGSIFGKRGANSVGKQLDIYRLMLLKLIPFFSISFFYSHRI